MASAFRQAKRETAGGLTGDWAGGPWTETPDRQTGFSRQVTPGRPAGGPRTEDEMGIRDREKSSCGLSVTLRRVTKQFGDGPAVLNGLDLAIHAGQFVAIVGRSGCGKSTLLRLIAGLDAPTGGELLRDGRPAAGLDPYTRVMFQDSRLLPWLTVEENVTLGVHGLGKREAKEKAREALRLVGLEERARDWPSVLSGGQKQRVALARALVGNPRLLLLDEPLGALDALTRIEMQRLIERLWQKQGFTALLVTHDVGEAVALADRVVMIERGTIALDLEITLGRPRVRTPDSPTSKAASSTGCWSRTTAPMRGRKRLTKFRRNGPFCAGRRAKRPAGVGSLPHEVHETDETRT